MNRLRKRDLSCIRNKGQGDFATSMGYLDGLGDRKLFKGDRGPDVTELQNKLLAFNSSYLPKYGADGDFGNETVEYLKKFQTAKKIKASGIADDATFKALGVTKAAGTTEVSSKSTSSTSPKGETFLNTPEFKIGASLALSAGLLMFLRARRA